MASLDPEIRWELATNPASLEVKVSTVKGAKGVSLGELDFLELMGSQPNNVKAATKLKSDGVEVFMMSFPYLDFSKQHRLPDVTYVSHAETLCNKKNSGKGVLGQQFYKILNSRGVKPNFKSFFRLQQHSPKHFR
jgi:hypothetical protein